MLEHTINRRYAHGNHCILKRSNRFTSQHIHQTIATVQQGTQHGNRFHSHGTTHPISKWLYAGKPHYYTTITALPQKDLYTAITAQTAKFLCYNYEPSPSLQDPPKRRRTVIRRRTPSLLIIESSLARHCLVVVVIVGACRGDLEGV